MSMKFAVGLLAAALTVSAATAGNQTQISPEASFDLATSAGRTAGAPLLRKANAPLSSRRIAKLRLPARNLPMLGGYRSQHDARQGASTFLWADASLKPAVQAPLKAELMADAAARDYLGQQASQLNTSKRAIADARLVDLHDTGKGPIIARYQQTQDGIAVFGKSIHLMMDRGMKLVASSGNFARSDVPVSKAKAGRLFHLQPEQALAIAFADFSGEPQSSVSFGLLASKAGYSSYAASPGFGEIQLVGEQRSRKFWYPIDGRLEPAYYAEVHARSIDQASDYAYGYLISAADGAVLLRKSLIDYEAYTYRTYADASGSFQPFDSPLGNGYNPFVGTPGDGSTPRVAAASNLVTLQNGPISTNDPWLPAAATVTTGNNVDAYLDLSGTVAPDGSVTGDGFDAGSNDVRGTVTAANRFDYPYTPDADPSTNSQRQFAVVDLFYLNNWLHDWWYDSGFNEAAGNAQASNLGRGGVEGDRMRVEGQDFRGRNNANMSTPPDGGTPRMQMFLFDGPEVGEVAITPSAAATYNLAFNTASFGPQSFDVRGTLINSAPANGCTAFTNAADVAGKLVIIDRGACTFVVKARNAQAAGALGVLIANNAAGAAPGLGGTDTSITIGTLSVSQADGQRIRGDLASPPVSAHLLRLPGIDVDGTVDAQIVAHEWFHYASNRLVGDAMGLSNQQGRGMGEGWSDFNALMLSVRPEDRGVNGNGLFQGAYPTGFYATNDSYFGIRRAPYSTSLSIFPMTYKHIEDGVPLPTGVPIAFGANGAANSEVHNTGEIWANTLWEFYNSLLNDPRYSFLQAQNRMKNYLIAGLKMTPNAPTLLEARDGLLAATYASDSGDFELMARAFAKRGMGVGAVAPDRENVNNRGVVESFVALQGSFEVLDAELDFGYVNGAEGYIDNDGELDPGETALLTLQLRSNGTRDITSPVVAQLGSDGDVSFGNGGSIRFPASAAAPIRYGSLLTGSITVKLNSAATTAQLLNLSISFPNVGASSDEVREATTVPIQLSVNYDIAPGLRASDDLETPLAAVKDWATAVVGEGKGWSIADGNDPALAFDTGLLWYAPNLSRPADVLLTTPALTVGRSNFSMAFQHYFQFEFDGPDANGTPVGFDGGVIEISSDNGATWRDVLDAGGSFTSGAGYNGYFVALGSDGNATPDGSGDHAGFVDNNFANNGGFLEPLVLSFGTAYTGMTVRLRFRLVTDSSVGEFGWAVDNLSFTGISNLPFSEVVAENSTPDNRAPAANAGSDSTVALGSSATLNGSASSDPDGDTLSYAWTQTSGAATPIVNANAATASVTPLSAGSYVFTLTVTDSRTLTSSDTVTVVVNRPPVANAGADSTVQLGSSAALNGSASSDPDGDPLSYAWTQTAGATTSIANAGSALASVQPSAAGTYVFQLRVTDSKGATTVDSTTVLVNPVPVPEVIPPKEGGGALGLWLLLPGFGLAALRRRRR